MKICNICNINKPLNSFSKDKSRKDGLNIKCTSCRKNYRNKSVYTKYQKEYRKLNKDKIAKYTREKRKIDPLFKLKSYLRTRIWSILKKDKYKNTEELLGASFKEVQNHIESTFTEGMTWKNYGKWHVDHKIPLASAKTKEEVEKLCHFTNLQALWAEDNFKKHSKL